MTNFRVITATRNAALDLIKTAVDAGAGPGTIKFYTGTQPVDANTALSGNNLLGTLTCADPCAPAASGGVLTFSAITQDNQADATGTATFVRVADSTGATVFDADVGTTGTTVIMPSTSITLNEPIQITSFTVTWSGTVP